MSAPVDVLDQTIRFFDERMATARANDLREARAAVAELIEALRNSDDLLREFCARTGADMTQLVANSAALARVGGGK